MDLKRLIQLMGMTGSKHDGEALNAVRLANRELGKEGITWEEALSQTNGAGKRYTDQDLQNAVNQAYKTGLADGEAKARLDRFQSSAPKRTVAAWQVFAKECRDQHFGELNDWEEEFVMSFIDRGWRDPTPKQRACFERIADKLGIDCPD